MKQTTPANKVKKASSEELLATSRMLAAAKEFTPTDSPNIKLASLIEKELARRIKKLNLMIIERNV